MKVNPLDDAASNRTAHGDAVQRARRRDVVDIQRLSGHFGSSFLAVD